MTVVFFKFKTSVIYPRGKQLLILLSVFVFSSLQASPPFFQQDKDTTNTLHGKFDSVHSHHYNVPNLPAEVPLLYQRQSKSNLVQSVGIIDGSQLEKFPTAVLSNTFAGQLAGLFATQTTGKPGNDVAVLNLRGESPLILVDGIPRNFLTVNPEQVETVTVLKDALSTAMLGIRGMNGAILIATRSKSYEPGSHLSFTAQAGVQTPTKQVRPLSAYQYAQLYNEALANDGLAPLYTQTDLETYKSGTDPYGHPDVNWYNTILRKNSAFSRYTLNADGNYTNIKYFVSLDYMTQQGLLNESAANNYETNANYRRYTVRTNLDISIDKRTTANVNVLGSIQNFREPGNGNTFGTGVSGLFNGFLNTPNNAYPVFNPDGTYGGNRAFLNNLYAQSTASGYRLSNERDVFVDLGATRNLDDVLRGLWMKAKVSFSMLSDQFINRNKKSEIYEFSKDAVTGDTSYDLLVNRVDQVNTDAVGPREQQTYAELSMGYDHSVRKHEISGILLASSDSYQYGSQLDEVFRNIAGRINYNYDKRYLFEVASSYSGNNRYHPSKRYGFFPSAGVGWNIHNEAFLKSRMRYLTQLKLRATYGMVGNANSGYYLYKQNYVAGAGYMFSTGMAAASGIGEGAAPNTNRTWEKANKFNLGLDVGFSKDHGWLNVDYFNNREYDLLQVPGHNSDILGTSFPEENLGINRYYGIELNAGWADKVGMLHYYISANVSTLNSKVIFMDEVTYPYQWMQRTGSKIGQPRGYIAEGFFDGSNLTLPTKEGYKPVPGDLRYKDLNNDGVINQFDQTAIGTTSPLTFFGTSLGLQVKGFDLAVLLQGAANRNLYAAGSYMWAFQNNGKGQAYEHNLNRWTPQTASTATYPRLSVGTNDNNESVSSFWMQQGDYLRLKNVELGYNVNSKKLNRLKLYSCRLFVNGLNLITFSKYKLSDPESYTGSYPIQKVINGGINIKF